MLPELDAREARVIGCLIEKSVVTPDQYPLTLNALTNACNQKSSREPVMSLSQGEVQHTVRKLADRSMVRIAENFKSRVEKYTQTFCNTRYNEFQFDEAALAVVCVLLLRGAQSPGEIRANSRRLHAFADNAAVVDCIGTMNEHPQGPLVVELPRAAGQRDSRYMHCFSGDVEMAAVPPPATPKPETVRPARAAASDLEERVARLERDVAELKELLGRD